MRRFLWIPALVVILTLGFYLGGRSHHREALASICQLVGENFYRSNSKLEIWVSDCVETAARLPGAIDNRQFLDLTQTLLDKLEVSHLAIYSPAEDAEVWQGRALDTGIRAHFVEDALIVRRVIKGSSAENQGVQRGDEILRIEGAGEVTPWGARSRGGWFHFNRLGAEFDLKLEPTDLKIDSAPYLESLPQQTGLLTIPSFRSEYFESKSWRTLAAGFPKYNRLIIDLRENAGGNFVAMLRALSPFMCEPMRIGSVDQPRKDLPDLESIQDFLSDGFQIGELSTHKRIWLETYTGYGCYQGKVTVLAGSLTQSVAEIFAYAMSLRPQTRIWGQRTAGDVVIAVWYSIPQLGRGYTLSIPEAVFKKLDESALEGVGVEPSKSLYFELHEARQGLDSWVLRALN